MSNSKNAPPSPVRALRDVLGDPKPPAITRKVTACVACRKQKVKCYMRESQPPCTRCKARGLPCTVNRSLQMVLESDVMWKHAMEAKVKALQDAISKMANHVLSPEAIQQLELPDMSSDSLMNGVQPEVSSPGSDGSNQGEVVMELDSGPGAIPGFYINQSPSAPVGEPHERDLISRGIITLDKARLFFDTYKSRLDHFPYRILGDHSSITLDSIRETTPLLTVAVCTVGALHHASPEFDRCYNEFLSLAAAQSFSVKGNKVDDIRALCIGAFWIGDLSWTLVGAAVRMATELQLHKSFFKALEGDHRAYLNARLYYLVYICDHHFSVPFGRPPMTRECEAVRNVRKFLDCKHATEDDSRIASQVLRWSLCSNILDTFGVDVDRPLSDSEIPHVRRFVVALDSLRAEWADRFVPNAHVGNYPRKGVVLQYHFVKLYLCSHVFRGAGSGQFNSRSRHATRELDEMANLAVTAALSILRNVVSDTEIQSFLDGLPVYFDIMIAFAVVFLLKISTKLSSTVQLDVQEVKELMRTLVSTLKKVTSTMNPRHLLVRITKGIDSLVQHCGLGETQAQLMPVPSTRAPPDPAEPEIPIMDFNSGWTVNEPLDPQFMGDFDFLYSQGIDFAANFPFMPAPDV